MINYNSNTYSLFNGHKGDGDPKGKLPEGDNGEGDNGEGDRENGEGDRIAGKGQRAVLKGVPPGEGAPDFLCLSFSF